MTPPSNRGPDDGTAEAERVVVLDVVGLRADHLESMPNLAELLDGTAADLRPRFPALTVPAQTTIATGRSPRTHGDVASGEYDRETDEAAFWERDRDGRTRLWEAATEKTDLTTGAFFFQHLIGTSADVAVTPSPIEDENNDLVEMNCWTNPDGFYDDLREELGHFPLHRYWGPGANEESTEWILDAARESVRRYDPDMLWVYVPHLDYAGLRDGAGSDVLQAALETVDGMFEEFLDALRTDGRWDETAVAVCSEYGFHDVDTPVFPNRALRAAGLLATADDGDVDLAESAAFAMVDHQVAHVYADDGVLPAVRDVLEPLSGIAEILDDDGKQARAVDHEDAGDLVLIAERDAWFQYYWWPDGGERPPYATDMDIHAKPGFDPCELFVGESGLASLDPSKVGGSHGRVDKDTLPLFGLGGPAAPDASLPETVDVRSVAPTVADLLGIGDDVGGGFERESVLPAALPHSQS
ncbi:alkaline phosphatase family protein [Halostella sp. JP-L12]|uniref:alkaline phosphatase family protein n=1 Tax=Halostella TaxID=1843185 RepID=UPI000EF7FE24|nr:MULTISPECIES: nucleotide pyrophosphatase/phosphodiesterase family protein [Halostella]NHN49406.1 alkaline phosphatase family protein [Halostella sp. JP-L12]